MDCIFCKIISGEIPCYKLYEDDKTLVFLDIENDVEGHCLVVPKQHVSDMDECTQQQYLDVMKTAKMMVRHFLNLGYDGANLVTNCKPAAGQAVGHFHVHVFPRKANDGAKLVMNKASKTSDLNEVVKKLRVR